MPLLWIIYISKHDLLPKDLKTKDESLTQHNRRASCFLNSVTKPGLAVGNSGCFVSLLTVMKNYKHDNVKELGIEIENKLAVSIKCKIIVYTDASILSLLQRIHQSHS